jgi:hypothetical protein
MSYIQGMFKKQGSLGYSCCVNQAFYFVVSGGNCSYGNMHQMVQKSSQKPFME